MSSKCIRLWAKKVRCEYRGYIDEAKRKIDAGLVQLEDQMKGKL